MENDKKNGMLDALGGDSLLTLRHDGKTYSLPKLKIGHLKAVQVYALDCAREESAKTLERLAGILPEQSFTELVREVMNDQGNWLRELMSPRGLSRLVYILIHDNHPDIDEDQAGNMFPVEMLDPLVDRVREVLGIQEGEEDVPLDQENSPETVEESSQ